MQNESDRRDDFIQKIYNRNFEILEKTGKKPLMKCVTYGCQANVHDSEKICGLLLNMGFVNTSILARSTARLTQKCRLSWF